MPNRKKLPIIDTVTVVGKRSRTFGIDKFASMLQKHNGLATGSRFTVHITSAQGYDPGLDEEEMALIANVNIPMPTFNFFLYKNASPTLRFPHDVFFEPLSMEFYCFDDNGEPFGKFAAWNRQLFSEGSIRMNDFHHYAEGKTCIVTEFNKYGEKVSEFTFYNLYPTQINKVLAYEHRSAPEKITVSFAYEYLTYEHF